MRDTNNKTIDNTIDMRDLERVVGGARQWAKGPDNTQLTLALQTVQQSIDSLKNTNNSSNSSLTMMLPMMLMMRNRG